MVIIGGVVAAIQIVRAPTHLERATVYFVIRDEKITRPRMHGFWIADTSNLLYIAPQFNGHDGPCQVKGNIVGIPHDRILRVELQARVPVYPRDKEPAPDPCPR